MKPACLMVLSIPLGCMAVNQHVFAKSIADLLHFLPFEAFQYPTSLSVFLRGAKSVRVAAE